MSQLTKNAISAMIDLYDLKQPTDDFLFYVYNHPEAPFKDGYKNQEIICLMSGGIDSYIGYYLAKRKYPNTIALYVDYGYGYATAEKEVIKCLGIDSVNIDISDQIKEAQKRGEAKWGEIFPGRNWILATIAAQQIKTRGEIWFMAVAGEIKRKWGDKSKLFLRTGSSILSQYHNKMIEIVAPFSNLTKGQLIKYYLQEGGSPELLKKTISCHYVKSADDVPCGNCMGCCHRYIGMKSNGIEEEYKDNVHINAYNLYKDAINDVFADFSEERIEEIKSVLNL